MHVYITGVILFVGNFVLKGLLRILAPSPALDTFTHLHIIRAIRTGRRIPERLDGFLVDEHHHAPFAYPFLLHLILCPFALPFLQRVERFIGPLVSSVDTVFVYAMALVLSGSLEIAMATAALYALVPIALSDALYLTPRIFGILAVNVALGSIVLFELHSHGGFLALAAVTGVGIFLLHKFTAQAFLVGALSLLAVAGSKVEIGLALACVALVLVLLPKGIYLRRLLADHLAVLKWWRIHVRRQHGGFLRIVAREAAQTPLAVSFFAFLFADPAGFAGGALRTAMLAWVLGLLLFALATSYIQPLQFLGGGERYKAFFGFPMAYLTVTHAARSGQLWPVLLLVLAGAATAVSLGREGWHVVRSASRSSRDLKALCDRLRNLPKDKVWAVGQGLGPQVLYWTGKKVFGALNVHACLKEPDLFPRLNVPPAQLIERFEIDYLLIDALDASLAEFDTGPYPELAREGPYRLLEVPREFET